MPEKKKNLYTKQFEILTRCSKKKDISEWNQWRTNNLGEEIMLPGVILIDEDLRGADLRGAKLIEAIFLDTNLSNANFRDASLFWANLSGANLSKADLSGANLSNASLSEASLSEASLSEAFLSDANLSKANFSGADLSGANLCFCRLVETDLTNAILTGAVLYGTARDDWKIEGIECDYVYWDSDKKKRCPKDRDFEPGEFEELYKSLPTIEFFFENGMNPIDPVIMDSAVSKIRERKPDYDLKIDSINARGLTPSIRLTVQKEEQKDEALALITQEHQKTTAELKGRIETLLEINKELINKPSKINYYLVQDVENVAIDGSTINNITQYIQNVTELQKIIATEPENSKTFAKIAKDKVMDILGGAAEDFTRGVVTKAAKNIVELGITLGPVIIKTAAYAYFKSLL